MSFATQKTADLAVFFNTAEFAETITYNGASINAIVELGLEDEFSKNVMSRGRITVKRSDVLVPAYRDAVVYRSNTYRVYQDSDKNIAISGDNEIWTLPIMIDERPRPMP